MYPKVKEIAGEAYTLDKVLEMMGIPLSSRRWYSLFVEDADSNSAVLQLVTNYAGQPRMPHSWESHSGTVLKQRLEAAWPECKIVGTGSHFDKSKNLTTETTSFSVPRPRWKEDEIYTVVKANQGWREATVLAFRAVEGGMERLVEYSMPKGTTALVIQGPKGDRNVSYRKVPKAFLKYMKEHDVTWEGQSQSGLVPLQEVL